jgi:hypothetical protein
VCAVRGNGFRETRAATRHLAPTCTTTCRPRRWQPASAPPRRWCTSSPRQRRAGRLQQAWGRAGAESRPRWSTSSPEGSQGSLLQVRAVGGGMEAVRGHCKPAVRVSLCRILSSFASREGQLGRRLLVMEVGSRGSTNECRYERGRRTRRPRSWRSRGARTRDREYPGLVLVGVTGALSGLVTLLRLQQLLPSSCAALSESPATTRRRRQTNARLRSRARPRGPLPRRRPRPPG